MNVNDAEGAKYPKKDQRKNGTDDDSADGPEHQ
jgi:hypothetical protein